MAFTYNNKYSPIARPRNNDIDDDEDDKQGMPFVTMQKKPYREFVQAFSAHHFHYYLSTPIGAPLEYVDMIHQITCAGPQDTVFIHLNMPGGRLDTGVQIINAMRNTQANVVTVLEGSAYSLGTLIFLAGDEMIVNDNSMMMFHNFNSGLIGKGNELVSELEATIKWFAALARDYYIPFLSEEEFERIVRGEDMWMQSPEIRERLIKMVEVLAQEAEENPEEEEDEVEVIETPALAKRARIKNLAAGPR